MPTPTRQLAVLALALALVACGTDDDAQAPPDETTTVTVPETTTETVSGTTTEEDEPPGPPFGSAPASGPAQGTALALLTDVRLGGHPTFDRIVFEFRQAAPAYEVRYVSPPIREDASGRRIQVAGSAFLSIRMEPASGFDLAGDAGETYTGPDRIDGAGAGTAVVEETVDAGDFEAVLTWVAGLEERRPIRVQSFRDPFRIVVDVRR